MTEQQTSANGVRTDTTVTRPRGYTHRAYLKHVQHRYPGEFNRKTRGGKRAARLVKEFKAALGIVDPTAVQRIALERAATLQAIAEDASIRRVNGDTTITPDDVVRLNHAAERAVRALKVTAPARASASPLRERLVVKVEP